MGQRTLDDSTLVNFIQHFSDILLANDDFEFPDLLGAAYEYPVTMVLDLLGSGMTAQDLLTDYSDLDSDDIEACLQFAAKLSDVKSLARTTG